MRLGIMQPYFFPYLGYFSLIHATDQWVVFDDIQFIKKGWINRNRILKPGLSDWQYIVAPVQSAPRETFISQTKIDETKKWKERILAQLEHYKKRAPYYEETKELLISSFEQSSSVISDFNVSALSRICQYVGVDFNYKLYSQTRLDLGKIDHPGQWALRISEELGAKEYFNPPGGKDIFKVEEFDNSGIEIKILTNNLSQYNQRNKDFISGLSILDVLMFNSPEETKTLIEDYIVEKI